MQWDDFAHGDLVHGAFSLWTLDLPSPVRSEWAIETGYHGKRDFAYCEDVRTRRCKANIIGAMMLARTPVGSRHIPANVRG